MSTVTKTSKSVAINPLKQSPPLGAALAFLGIKGSIPLFHGSQGCTAFAKVLLVRHFREAIPFATTAMDQVSVILGGEDNVSQAILTLVEKGQPDVIGLLTTGLTETRGDDIEGILKSFRQAHPELASLPILFAPTPDYKGSLQDGFAAAVQSMVGYDYDAPTTPALKPITILAGSLLSPGDVEAIKEMVEAFGFTPLVIPDLSGSLDGHLDDDYQTKASGGTTLEDLRNLGESLLTIAIGESMRHAAETLEQKFGTSYRVLPSLAGLDAVDQFLWLLAQTGSTMEVPTKYQRYRRQLQDAILDTHFYLGGKKVSLALEPDLLYQTSWLLHGMGMEIQSAVSTTNSPLLKELPVPTVTIGDLQDLEDLAVGSDLIITNCQGKALADRLHLPLYRLGYPIYDRLGNGSRCLVGYRGTMQFLFDLGNIFIDLEH